MRGSAFTKVRKRRRRKNIIYLFYLFFFFFFLFYFGKFFLFSKNAAPQIFLFVLRTGVFSKIAKIYQSMEKKKNAHFAPANLSTFTSCCSSPYLYFPRTDRKEFFFPMPIQESFSFLNLQEKVFLSCTAMRKSFFLKPTGWSRLETFRLAPHTGAAPRNGRGLFRNIFRARIPRPVLRRTYEP